MLSCISCVWLFSTLWIVAHQALLSLGFSRQEYCTGLPCIPPGDLCNPGIKPASFISPALAGEFFTTSTTWVEKAMAPHSSTLAWKIPWMEEPGRLQSMGWLGVGHDGATSFSLFTFMHWRRKWQPTLVFLLGESQGRGSLVAAVCGITQSRTRLKWLSSSSSTTWEAQLNIQVWK